MVTSDPGGVVDSPPPPQRQDHLPLLWTGPLPAPSDHMTYPMMHLVSPPPPPPHAGGNDTQDKSEKNT